MKITTSEKEKLTKDNTKTKIKLIIGITFLVFIESVTLVRLHNVQTTYSNKLAEANKQNKAYKEITEGNYDIGIELLKDTEVTNEQLAKVYFMIGQFDNAIARDPSLAKIIIEEFYAKNQISKILELNSNNNYVKYEQNIIKSREHK